jgi:hypothetical protein
MSPHRLLAFAAGLLLITSQTIAQTSSAPAPSSAVPAGKAVAAAVPMQRFIIEREIPGAGRMTADQLREAAAKSNKVLRFMGPDIQWVQSYVTGDKLYCVYNALSADLIKQHAERSGFPANRITAVATVIDPTTASSPVKP